jgi:hypothetical protein
MAAVYALTKPRVIQLIVFLCAHRHGAGRARRAQLADRCSWRSSLVFGIWLVSGAAAAFNCVVEKGIDAKMKRTAWRPTAKGQLSNVQTLLLFGRAVRCGLGHSVCLGQPADHVADLCHLRGLRGDLHRDPQAAHAAEHRDRRCLGGHAAGAGLGRHDRARSGRKR